MKTYVSGLGVEILSLDDVNAPELDIEESGKSPLENATIKAMAYYNALKMPVFSLDSGMYIDDLANDDPRQPGVHVRRINGRRLNDDELMEYYANMSVQLGGKMTARYRNGICLVINETSIHKHDGDDIATAKFIISPKPHATRNPGFPVDSLSIHIQSGQYYYDLNDAGNANKYYGIDDGFTAFFRRALNIQ